MTQEQIIRNCENLLEGNREDPLYQMLFMMMNMLMEMEANKITGSEKGEHNSERTDYRSSYRPRRCDTRLGPLYANIVATSLGENYIGIEGRGQNREAFNLTTRKVKTVSDSLQEIE